MATLRKRDVMIIVNRYIGVSQGYLGDFSYRTHDEFYSEYCDLENIDTFSIEGTTRERFIHILSNAEASAQAKIIRGILDKFPLGEGPSTRTEKLHDELLEKAEKLEGKLPISNPALTITSEVVEKALADAEALLNTTGAASGVDRIHTALHGYLKMLCDAESITYSSDPTLGQLLKLLRKNHSAFDLSAPRANDVSKILQSCGVIFDGLNPVRNKASLVHPNATILAEEEARLVINVTRSILHYLDSKVS